MSGDWFFPQNKFYGYENLAFQAGKIRKIYILVKKNRLVLQIICLPLPERQ
jgi:hypothetical protein